MRTPLARPDRRLPIRAKRSSGRGAESISRHDRRLRSRPPVVRASRPLMPRRACQGVPVELTATSSLEERAVAVEVKPEVATYQQYIDGEWVGAGSGATYEVHNPSTEEVIGRVPASDRDD